MLRKLAPVFLVLLLLAGCGRAYGNKQTLRTTDCGVTWTLLKPGDVIPASVHGCQYTITLPDYPLQGEARFKTSFKDRVLAQVEVAYDYSIVDGIAFLGEAKYLGRANSDGNDDTNSSGMYETAENAVIDKRIREAATTLLREEDIVDFSQAEFEEKLLTSVNEMLAQKGVSLNFLAFVPIPDEQTRLAIDMLTAMKVYESRGLGELGQQVAISRAGATKIEVISNNSETPPQ